MRIAQHCEHFSSFEEGVRKIIGRLHFCSKAEAKAAQCWNERTRRFWPCVAIYCIAESSTSTLSGEIADATLLRSAKGDYVTHPPSKSCVAFQSRSNALRADGADRQRGDNFDANHKCVHAVHLCCILQIFIFLTIKND